jgi:putative glutamine amidotransferase
MFPGNYGEAPLRPEWSGDAIRDRFEIDAIHVALELGKPVLGICRGHQVVNVALGGSLHQDISTLVEGSLVHRDWERYEIIEHAVRLEPGSWVAQVYADAPELLTNTVHHQAIKQLATPLRATAWAPDGIIEAVEQIDEQRWIAGVQWHPEWLDGSSEGGSHRTPGLPIFERFAGVCGERGR